MPPGRSDPSNQIEPFQHSPDARPPAIELDFRRLADALPQLVWMARPDGYIDYYNQSCLDYAGMPVDELLGWGWQRVLHPDDVEPKRQRWAESLRTGKVFEIEYRLRQFDGAYRWHLGHAMPLCDGTGTVVRWFGTSTDIEDQKRAQQALRESHQALERTVAERTTELTRINAALTTEIGERRRIEGEISLLHTIILEVAAAEDLSTSLEVLLRRACKETGWAIGQAWVPRPDLTVLECSGAWFTSSDGLDRFRAVSEPMTFAPGVGLPGRVWRSRQPAWVEDVTLDLNFPRAQTARDVGLKAALGIPIVAGGQVVAVLEFFLREPRQEDAQLVKVISTAAAQLDLVLERKQAESALRKSEAALRASYERIQDLAGRLIAAQEVERARIARELHDDINQQVAGLSIALSSLKRRTVGQDVPALDEMVSALQQRTVRLVEHVRQLSHDLHPGVFQHVGLVAALESHCAEFEQQHRIEVAFAAAENLETLEPDVALCLFRTTQEALRNVARHAGARHARITLCRENSELTLTVADDGRGFDPVAVGRAGRGLGLLSMEERARLLQGKVTVESRPDGGTTVRVTIPCAAPPPAV